MVNVKDLAKYLLFLFKEQAQNLQTEESDITPLKLQKLLYYCQGYALALTGGPLFAESIEAWRYGPVVPSVYREYNRYANSCIPIADITASPEVDAGTAAIARLVMRIKGRYSAYALIDMTHRETPWKSAYAAPYCNEVISEEVMKAFFTASVEKELPEEQEAQFWESLGEPLSCEDWDTILADSI